MYPWPRTRQHWLRHGHIQEENLLEEKSGNHDHKLQALIYFPHEAALQIRAFIVPLRDVTAQSRLGDVGVVSSGQGLPFHSLMTLHLIPAINT